MTSINEVQQLTKRLVALSQFISCAGEKSMHLFASINKLPKFAWTEECEKVVGELKKLLSAPPILVRPKDNSPLIFYLAALEKAISSILVQDSEGDGRPVYFFSKVLKGA